MSLKKAVNLMTLKPFWQSKFILFIGRNPIIPHQWIGEHQDLPSIRRISKGFRISHHSCAEDHLT